MRLQVIEALRSTRNTRFVKCCHVLTVHVSPWRSYCLSRSCRHALLHTERRFVRSRLQFKEGCADLFADSWLCRETDRSTCIPCKLWKVLRLKKVTKEKAYSKTILRWHNNSADPSRPTYLRSWQTDPNGSLLVESQLPMKWTHETEALDGIFLNES